VRADTSGAIPGSFGRRPTRLLVDLAAIESNASIIRKRLSPATRLLAVVKANGYGHGAVQAAQAAAKGGASNLGVATVAEAVELRSAGVEAPILVLGSSDPSEAPHAAEQDIAIGIGDHTQGLRMLDALEGQPPVRPLAVHLKIDTGMRRFGVAPALAPLLARSLANNPHVHLEGVYSHFAEADSESPQRMEEQLACFNHAVASISSIGIEPGIAHISNSAALLRNRAADLDMVRAGICLYGIPPSEFVPLFPGMRAALEWRAAVQHVTEMAPGDRTGYGGTYVASDRECLALLPIGYADGFPRHLSNRGWVGYRGHQLPVRGRISMDQCAVGIPPGLDLRVGEEVTVIGNGEVGAPDANELAEVMDTIGYEIVSRLSRRIPVDYI
jgi:alanine racemase